MSTDPGTAAADHDRPSGDGAASILFLSHDPATAGHVYRVINPVAALRDRGWQARWLAITDPEVSAAANAADVVVAFRCPLSPTVESVIAACRRRGRPFVYDVDDLIFDPGLMATGSVAYLDTLPEVDRRRWIALAADHQRVLAEADAAVVATPPLARAAARHCPHALVVPNTHSPAALQAAATARGHDKPSRLDGRPRIGFASGTPTHQRDFRVAAVAAATLLARRSELLLTVVGAVDLGDFPELAPHAARIEVRPRVAFDDVASELARFEINLAPLELGNPFCEAKSPIRCTLASAVGVPTVASPTEPLRAAVVDGVTGILATTPAEWERALDRLLDDPPLRARMGVAAGEWLAGDAAWASWCDHVHETYATIRSRRAHDRRSPPSR